MNSRTATSRRRWAMMFLALACLSPTAAAHAQNRQFQIPPRQAPGLFPPGAARGASPFVSPQPIDRRPNASAAERGAARRSATNRIAMRATRQNQPSYPQQPEELPFYADRLPQASWTYTQVRQPEPLRKHDIIYVAVNETATTASEGEVQRRKNALFNAVLSDWIIFKPFRWIKPSPQSDGDPRVAGTLNHTVRAENEIETREQVIIPRIAARIVEIRPNGNAVIEAYRVIRINNETWEVNLSGECRTEDITPDRTIESGRLFNLRLTKRERGHVRDSYRRGWLTRIYDEFNPF